MILPGQRLLSLHSLQPGGQQVPPRDSGLFRKHFHQSFFANVFFLKVLLGSATAARV